MTRIVALTEAAPSSGRVELRHVLDTPREPAFDRLTRLAAHSLRAPISLMTFVDLQRQWFKSSYGLAEFWAARRETPLSHSFCQYVVRDKKPLIVPDARQDPLVQENLAIPELGVAAYLGVPLTEDDGTVLGSLSVIEGKPRSWTERDVALLQDFAALTMMELRLRVEVKHRHEAEQSLIQAQKLEALSHLSGAMAHDFKNILLGLHGYVELLEQEANLPEPFAAYLRELKKGIDRGSRLVRQLLGFSRKEPLRPERVNLNRVLREIEPLLRRTLAGRVRFELSLHEHLSDVQIDQMQLQQVILNLVINARDATPTGGLITVSTDEHQTNQCRQDRKNECHVELAVHDSGCGMDENTMQHIFEPFFTTKSSAEGTGLGLFTVYGVVQQSGGCIEVDSELGKGTRFRILLPRLPPSH